MFCFVTQGFLNKSGTILFMGLKNAGKSTLFSLIKDEEGKQPNNTPTPHSSTTIEAIFPYYT